jgi:hypothetical protein
MRSEYFPPKKCKKHWGFPNKVSDMARNMKMELHTFSLILYQLKKCGHRIHVLFIMYDVYIWHCRIKLFLRHLPNCPCSNFSLRRSFSRNLAENSEAASFLGQTTSFETEVQEREPWDFYVMKILKRE